MDKNEVDIRPERIVVSRLEKDRYGTVEGLDRDELADPAELERQVFLQMYEPLLSVPFRSSYGSGQSFRGTCDLDGFVDYGAFDSIDFKRLFPSFDKARYKIDKLKEQLADSVIRLGIVCARIETANKYLIMKHLKEGVLELDDLTDMDLWNMGRLYLRSLRLKKEIKNIRNYRNNRHEGI